MICPDCHQETDTPHEAHVTWTVRMPVQYPKMVATWAASDSERPVKRPSPQAMVNARIAVSMLRDAARQCGVLSTMERDSYVMAIHDVLDTIDPPQ